jgi:hypothetical protein
VQVLSAQTSVGDVIVAAGPSAERTTTMIKSRTAASYHGPGPGVRSGLPEAAC